MWTWLVQSLGAGLLLARASYAAVLVISRSRSHPVASASSAQQCTIQILERTFGNSYGDPEIVQYTPPTDCGAVGSWAGISLNFTVTSNGTQYDRLGIFTFQNVEIWRTSTPEPTTDGIIWTYLKDATRYLPLFSEPGTFILELDNILATGLNGQYATTLTATFYASSDEYPSAPRANTIIPVTTLANNTGDDASVPPTFSLNVTVPQNAVAIYAELYASGNGNEEFWYYNVANDYLGDLPSGLTYGNGPFREVRMLVDGQVAGVAFPYAVIFTGGISPTAWRPITSYGALDLPTYFIDLTPFVPVLTDGQPHNISIDVVSAETNHTINDNWYVSGNLQVVTDSSSGPTTGNITVYNVEPYAETSTTGTVGDNGDLTVTVTAKHSIQIQSEFTSGSGQHTSVIWTQDLEYSNTQYYLDNLLVNNVAQTATGSFLSTHNGVPALSDDFSYPLYINMTYLDDNYDSWTADFDHSYNRVSSPSPFILGSTINERQVATSYFVVSSNGNYGNGTNNNTFNYVDSDGDTYWRNVGAADNNVTYDSIGGSLSGSSPFMLPLSAPLSQGVMAKPRLPGGK
ncbi:peptide N-acetyl-beta-D-glucosaminyl asparaginase amidase A-domain-containing protein [Fomitopsis serialis]|uniref:peptide N-acetyl-beta-D-glucosaminyl asparaginase amidase A-domain-containing protein n=1 Tax=Fomitopsis serialis TaxID=139415 RepID=UPI002008E6E1|nr:peptide N-acetyl-beta-D-glucosaminyl asparaginase amidase A-domain-containing protein [Neoantrodia serialis]KAH9935048.1 peptide N-acetyl-beta-D-glucosaminyl asparaginase amidase A-domain-containing protein [Neoantrodia serialis]